MYRCRYLYYLYLASCLEDAIQLTYSLFSSTNLSHVIQHMYDFTLRNLIWITDIQEICSNDNIFRFILAVLFSNSSYFYIIFIAVITIWTNSNGPDDSHYSYKDADILWFNFENPMRIWIIREILFYIE